MATMAIDKFAATAVSVAIAAAEVMTAEAPPSPGATVRVAGAVVAGDEPADVAKIVAARSQIAVPIVATATTVATRSPLTTTRPARR
jgi:hypothetical protein